VRGAQQLCTILHSRKLFYTEMELEGGDSTMACTRIIKFFLNMVLLLLQSREIIEINEK
jgi:hypothetical protein